VKGRRSHCLTQACRKERRHRKRGEKKDNKRKPSRRRKSGPWLMRVFHDPNHRDVPLIIFEFHRAKTEATALTQIKGLAGRLSHDTAKARAEAPEARRADPLKQRRLRIDTRDHFPQAAGRSRRGVAACHAKLGVSTRQGMKFRGAAHRRQGLACRNDTAA
jgi:hypothetical protein